MSSELESVSLPAEFLEEARGAARNGVVGNVADYVAEAVRLRLAKDRALAQVTRLFGGPSPEDVLALVRQRAGASRRFVIGGRVLDVTVGPRGAGGVAGEDLRELLAPALCYAPRKRSHWPVASSRSRGLIQAVQLTRQVPTPIMM
jgi:hypothetical protein